MKTIRFTQNINLAVTIEAEIPEDWDAHEFAKDYIMKITVDEPDDPMENGDGFSITELSLDGAETTETMVWDS